MTPSRHTLLAVAGMTPATVTEALWALAIKAEVPISEVVVLTTEKGERRLSSRLKEVLDDFKRDFPGQGNAIKLRWRVFPAEDILDSPQNEELSDWILRETAALCSNDDLVVHASIAGGRKTMSFLLGAAMQLVGRPRDYLYHVLVDPAFEISGFYYPAPKGSRREFLELRDGLRSTSEASIHLAEVPFVRLGGILRQDVARLAKKLTFRQLSSRAEDAISDQFLATHVCARRKIISYRKPDGTEAASLHLSGSPSLQHLLYVFLLYKRQAGTPKVNFKPDSATDQVEGLLDELLEFQEKFVAGRGETRETLQALRTGWNTAKASAKARRKFIAENWFKSFNVMPSRMRKELEQAFKAYPGVYPYKYGMENNGGYFSVTIPPDRIHFDPPIKLTGKRSTKK